MKEGSKTGSPTSNRYNRVREYSLCLYFLNMCVYINECSGTCIHTLMEARGGRKVFSYTTVCLRHGPSLNEELSFLAGPSPRTHLFHNAEVMGTCSLAELFM